MAINFAQASSQYLSVTSGVLQEGMGGSFWYRAGILGGTRGIMRAYDSGGSGDYVEITASNSAGNRKFSIQYFDSSGLLSDLATTTNQWSSNTWINVQFLWLDTQVAIRANGGTFDVGVGHSAGVLTTPDRFEIAHSNSAYMNGQLAEFALFSGFTDSDYDYQILDSWVAGLSPRHQKYASHYWQMLGASDLTDQHSGVTLTANNTPTTGTHHVSPIWYKTSAQRVIVPPAAVTPIRLLGNVRLKGSLRFK